MLIEKVNPKVQTELVSTEELSGLQLDLLVNTTSLGMHPGVEQTPLPDMNFSGVGAVVDLIYNPLQTRLLREASQAGAKTVNGLEMLVAQAVYSVEIWMGGNVVSKVDMQALTAELEAHFS